jgi:hypothetical protein
VFGSAARSYTVVFGSPFSFLGVSIQLEGRGNKTDFFLSLWERAGVRA